MTRRSTIEIQHDILNVINNGYKKITHIMYRCNLSWDSMKASMKKLIDNGYIIQVDKRYTITRDGITTLKALNRVRKPIA